MLWFQGEKNYTVHLNINVSEAEDNIQYNTGVISQLWQLLSLIFRLKKSKYTVPRENCKCFKTVLLNINIVLNYLYKTIITHWGNCII